MKIKGLKNRYDFASNIYDFDACMSDLAVCKAVNTFSNPAESTLQEVSWKYNHLYSKFGVYFPFSGYEHFSDYMRDEHTLVMQRFVLFLGCLIYLHSCADELEEVAELLRFIREKHIEDVSENLRL